MYSLAVRSGDLSISVSRRADIVNGRDKLLQDLRLWLLEPMGLGPTTRSFGSYLTTYVGTDSTTYDVLQIQAEVKRVVGLYQAWQYERLRQGLIGGTVGNWSKAEIIDRVLDVVVTPTYDSATVTISLLTLAAAPNNTVQMALMLPGMG